MQFSGIRECGANNILSWAIKNGADIKSDNNVIALVTDETYYMLEFKGVNFLELFKLSQIYREKMRIMAENKADIPTRRITSNLFQGEFENEDGTKTPYYEIAEFACKSLINLSLQMNADSDIIESSTCKMYMPMLCRTFDIQIPFAFADLVRILGDKCNIIFSKEYPMTLNLLVDHEDFKIERDMIMLMMLKNTTISRYPKEYEQMLKLVKYAALRKIPGENLTKHKLAAFYKYDPISHSEVRCDMFNITKEELAAKMKTLGRINTPLQVEFAIQVPLQYMFDLLNTYPAEVLKVKFDTSITDTLETGIIMDNFVTQEFAGETDDEVKINEYENAVSEYKVRIMECNKTTMAAIGSCIKSDTDIDQTSIFALLPAIYQTKATITINLDDPSKYDVPSYASVYDLIRTMLEEAVKLSMDISTKK